MYTPYYTRSCITHQHHSIGDVERFNRTLGDTIIKKLYRKPHLTEQYWGYAYMDCVIKHNMCGSIHGPDSTPYDLWHDHKPDLEIWLCSNGSFLIEATRY